MPEMTFTIPADDFVTDSNEAPRPKESSPPEGLKALQDQIATLTREREDDRKRVQAETDGRRQAEERERRERAAATQARADADAARKDSAGSQRVALDNAIATTTAALDSAEAAYAAAFDAGKAMDAAKAQRMMAEAAAQLHQLNAGKQALEDEEAAAKRTPPRNDVQPTEQEAFDTHVRNMRLPPRAERWIRDHPEYVKDDNKRALLMRAHHFAQADGYVFDSDAYYRFLDEKLGHTNDGSGTDDDRGRKQQQEERRMPVSAPVSRGTTGNGSGGGDNNRVSLNEAEQARATDGTLVWNYDDPDKKFKKGDPIGVREYARRKAIMMKEGRYNTPYA
jgi:hypothetical protein